jgi:uncharacterized glyoxalase superfamily protein PhnB
MIRNRPVPTDSVLPHIAYLNVDEAIAWLTRTFGFIEHYRYGNPTSGAQLFAGNTCIMLETAKPKSKTPAQLGYGTQSLTIFLEDLESHFHQTKSAGATVVEDLHETVYGELQYAALDLDGHHWLFSRHARDLSPDQWGAQLAPLTHSAKQSPDPH